MLVLGWQMRIEMKILLNWSPLRQLFTYIQERFTFLVLLCWPAIIWLFCRVGVWLTDNVYELLGKITRPVLHRVSAAVYDPRHAAAHLHQLGGVAVHSLQYGDGLHLGFTSLYESP